MCGCLNWAIHPCTNGWLCVHGSRGDLFVSVSAWFGAVCSTFSCPPMPPIQSKQWSCNSLAAGAKSLMDVKREQISRREQLEAQKKVGPHKKYKPSKNIVKNSGVSCSLLFPRFLGFTKQGCAKWNNSHYNFWNLAYRPFQAAEDELRQLELEERNRMAPWPCTINCGWEPCLRKVFVWWIDTKKTLCNNVWFSLFFLLSVCRGLAILIVSDGVCLCIKLPWGSKFNLWNCGTLHIEQRLLAVSFPG